MSYCLHSGLGLLSGAGVGYNGAIGKAFGKSHPSLNLFSIRSTICFFMFVSNLGPDVSSKLSQWELNRLLPPYREICWSNWGSRLSLPPFHSPLQLQLQQVKNKQKPANAFWKNWKCPTTFPI